MEILKKISNFVGKWMAIIVLVIAAFSLFVPSAFTGWLTTKWVNPLLMVVMFGMGLTIKPSDFVVVFKRPKDIVIGFCAQFGIMPFLAWMLGKMFHLPPELLVGVVLVGTCPGGTSSNVMTYLSKGDVPFSVGMTCVSTLLAPLMTPFITYLILKETVDVNMLSMFLSIVKVVLIPIGLGLVINHFFEEQTQKAVTVLPLISVTAIVLIIAAVVAANSKSIMGSSAIVFVVVILHNVLGYLLGFGLASLFHMPLSKKKALSIEVGMQNSGLAVSLAKSSFAAYPLATVPGAVFSVWHNISGAILSNIYNRFEDKPAKTAKA